MYTYLIHADVWQKPRQYCNHPSIKNKERLKKKKRMQGGYNHHTGQIGKVKFVGLSIFPTMPSRMRVIARI